MKDKTYQDICDELYYQRTLEWDDTTNSAGDWSSYICQYATRWSVPLTWDKYNFRTCMVKVAAIAVAAIEDYDAKKESKNET